jgi:hypothetical protein
VDSLVSGEKGNTPTSERKALIEPADIGNVLPVGGTQHVERGEAGSTKGVVFHLDGKTTASGRRNQVAVSNPAALKAPAALSSRT